MNTMQQELEQKAFGWAVRHGILSADEPTAAVTREELAVAMYRGLNIFFGEIVAFLERDEAKKGGQSGGADLANAK